MLNENLLKIELSKAAFCSCFLINTKIARKVVPRYFLRIKIICLWVSLVLCRRLY